MTPLLMLLVQPRPPAAGISFHRAAVQPIRYHLALPEGWTSARTWPVVVAIPDAHRDFEANLRRFVAARGSRPYILVAPEVVTCGGVSGQVSPPHTYSPAEWARIRQAGDFEFDDACLAAVLAEVQARWKGEPRACLTGWEAGGHTVWAQAFRHPERWRAVAVVSPNYQGRGLSEAAPSRDPSRSALPLKVFWCGSPGEEEAPAYPFLRAQAARALAEARAHGFAPAPDTVVPGAPHGPACGAVLGWFDHLRAGERP
ncbi:MAG: hypothetical protein U0P81_06285 [Holophagaceae bacterium]